MLGGDVLPGGVPFPQYFLAGIAATGIMLSSFQAIGTSIAAERENGQLERLQLLGTPPLAYFAGKAGQVLVTTAAQLAILLPVAHYAYDVPLPAEASKWLTFVWVAALGGLAGTVLGIAASALRGTAASVGHRDRRVRRSCSSSSPASSSPSRSCRRGCSRSPRCFPLKWLTQGMRSAFLPDEAAAVGGRRELGARPDRPGACRMGDHRRRGVRADVPLASGPTDDAPVSLRPVAVDSSCEEVGGDRPLSDRGWRVTLIGLHVVFAVLVGIAVVDDRARAGRRRPKPLLLAALAALALGLRLPRRARALVAATSGAPAAYLTVLVVVFGVLAWDEPALLFLLFIGYTHVWFMVESLRRRDRLDARCWRSRHRRTGRSPGRAARSRCRDRGRRWSGWPSASRWASGSAACSSRASSGPC